MICTYKDLTYSLTQTNRKTLSIYIEPDGQINVRAPNTIDIPTINNILDMKRAWIYKAMAEMKELNHTRVTRHLVNGEGYLYLGKSYRLKIERDMKPPLSLRQGYFVLDESHTHKAKELFKNFYKRTGKKHIIERVNNFKKKLGVNPKQVRVMELQNRWASRSKTGINFHWKVMLAPLTIIDYIIVHELAHYKHEGHNSQFWEVVESILPNYDEKRNWLRLNGANLDI